MKSQFIILALSAVAFSSMAQETNLFRHGDRHSDCKKDECAELIPGKKGEIQEHRLQLIKKSLKEIGVTKEEALQVFELQKQHHRKMKANLRRSGKARSNLSALQDSGASEAEMDEAIQKITDAQAEQLKIIVRNRLAMEKILGKEKYALFMENARAQFRRHGRRGGSNMPSRPPVDTSGAR